MAPNLTKTTPPIISLKPPTLSLKSGNLTANGHTFLHSVPSHITCSQQPTVDKSGLFIGFKSENPLAHHVAPLGKLTDIPFMSIFRFKIWWTTHWAGTNGRDVQHETQMMILDRSGTDFGSARPYVLLLPLIEGDFRASIQPGESDYVDLCVESGSSTVKCSSFSSSLYVHAADDPFMLVRDAMRAVKAHLGTFKLLEEKEVPGIVDKFGWCTWDAFYLKVHPEGVLDGVSGLAGGGCPPGFVLIDDGWQSICHDEDDPSKDEGMNRTSAGEQMPCRLVKFEENYKFRKYRSRSDDKCVGMKGFVKDLKSAFKTVENVYVWHALCGYWGGVRPGVEGVPEAKIVTPRTSPGVEMTMEDLAVDKILANGVGLVGLDKAHQLYEGLHSRLEEVGIDGVKVDVIQLLELLGEDYGGRVELGKAYYKGLNESVKKHFKGNGVIASMEHCNDFMFLGTENISLGRVGDDFWCTDPNGEPFWLQGVHMVHCAFNSLWMGNFIQPDWDMFQSTHPCALFHAASRAMSGGPIYVSDSVGQHDLGLLRKLVLPDGSILRCEGYALPTKDCFFVDPLHDGKTMLKIWNLNKFTGVLGAFNCQGGGWIPELRTNKPFPEHSRTVTAGAKASDIEWSHFKTSIETHNLELFAVYSLREQKLQLLKLEDGFQVTLDPFNFELFVVSPVKSVKTDVLFAPIGLVNMLNSGGALQSVEYDESGVKIGVKGVGEMKAFSSKKPKSCMIGTEEVKFEYGDDMVSVLIPWSGSADKLSLVEYVY